MKVIKSDVDAELTEKKSKFIAHLYYVESEKQAKQIISDCKKKYHDARHNCYAYRIMQDDNLIENFSDDGEPSGTAGMPMLTFLNGNDLVNVLIIVTRYFGGILLGTGGLVRAYSGALELAFDKAELVEVIEGIGAGIEFAYSEISKFEYYCKKNNILICNKEFSENIKVLFECKQEEFDKLKKNRKDLNFTYILLYKIENKLIHKIWKEFLYVNS